MSDELQKIQMKNTMIVSLTALGVLVVAFLIAVLALRGASSPGEAIAAAVGAVTTTIGTLAGLVAGKAAGESGKAEAEKNAAAARQDADKAQAQARILAGALSGDQYHEVETSHPGLFQG